MNHATNEQRAAILSAGIRFGATDHHCIESMPVVDHVLIAFKQFGTEQTNQHPEAEMVALVWSGRKQKQIPAMVTNGFGEFEVFRLLDLTAVTVNAQVMRLVEDHQIPGRCGKEFFHPRRAFEGIDRDDQTVVFCKGVGLSVGDIPLASEYLKVEIKNIVQFPAPVFHESCGHNHDGPCQFAPRGQFPKNKCSLNGLAETHLVGD